MRAQAVTLPEARGDRVIVARVEDHEVAGLHLILRARRVWGQVTRP
jgi:hypothetical protein